MNRLVSLREFGPFLYHPVSGTPLTVCVLLDPATGLYQAGDYCLEPIIVRDADGFIDIRHWKRDPQTGHKVRHSNENTGRQHQPKTGGGWVMD